MVYTVQELLEPDLDEIAFIVNLLNDNRAPPGEDGINTELLKIAENELLKHLRHLISDIWKSGKLETDWKTEMLFPMLTKGNDRTTTAENYEGISLLDVAHAVLCAAVLRKLEAYGSVIIGEYQCSHKKGRSTSDHIFTIRQVMEKFYEHDKELHMLFVDFGRAYDGVIKSRLWNALRDFGIPDGLVRLAKDCDSLAVRRRRPVGTSRRGDALSPVLFNLALERVVRDMDDDRQMALVGNDTLLAYGHRVVILGESRPEMITSAGKLIVSSRSMGVNVDAGKTKYMVVGRRPADVPENLSVGPHTFERVTHVEYLGVNINHRNDVHDEIGLRIGAANRCYRAMDAVFASRAFSRRTKAKLYVTYLRPVAMYGCETWSTTRADERRLLTFERKVLRRIYGPNRADAERTFNRFNKSVQDLLKSKRLEWAGRVCRTKGRLANRVLNNEPDDKRPRGRPRQRWLDRVSRDLEEMVEGDRHRWRNLINAAKAQSKKRKNS